MSNEIASLTNLQSHIEYITRFLSNKENVLNRYSSINIDDFDPNKINEFFEDYKQFIIRSVINNSIRMTNISIAKNADVTVDDLKPNKRREFDETVEDLAIRIFEKRKEAFEKTKIPYILLEEINFPHPAILFLRNDFMKALPNIPHNAQVNNANSLISRRDRLANKRIDRAAHKERTVSKSFIEKLEFVTAQYVQLKLFIKISKLSGIKFEKLSFEDLADYMEELQLFLEECNQRRQLRADKAFQDLISPEGTTALKETGKKPTKPVKNTKSAICNKSFKDEEKSSKGNLQSTLTNKAPIISPLQSSVLHLNKTKNRALILHSRIQRWDTPHLESIKTFKDYNPETKSVVTNYKDLGLEELQKAKECHNLNGIEKILSDEQLKQTYSYPYEYTDPVTNKVKKGLGLYAEKQSALGKESGIAYIGIGDDNVIFHAQFVPQKEKFLLPTQIARNLDFREDQAIEEKWNLVHSHQFSLVEGDLIQMEIGKKPEERVTYLFYPIQ